jgi:hypothetical protein
VVLEGELRVLEARSAATRADMERAAMRRERARSAADEADAAYYSARSDLAQIEEAIREFHAALGKID